MTRTGGENVPRGSGPFHNPYPPGKKDVPSIGSGTAQTPPGYGTTADCISGHNIGSDPGSNVAFFARGKSVKRTDLLNTPQPYHSVLTCFVNCWFSLHSNSMRSWS